MDSLLVSSNGCWREAKRLEEGKGNCSFCFCFLFLLRTPQQCFFTLTVTFLVPISRGFCFCFFFFFFYGPIISLTLSPQRHQHKLAGVPFHGGLSPRSAGCFFWTPEHQHQLLAEAWVSASVIYFLSQLLKLVSHNLSLCSWIYLILVIFPYFTLYILKLCFRYMQLQNYSLFWGIENCIFLWPSLS